jgi:hypothetical protein
MQKLYSSVFDVYLPIWSGKHQRVKNYHGCIFQVQEFSGTSLEKISSLPRE